MISAASRSSGVSAGRLDRWYLRSPVERCSHTSQTSSPGRCCALAIAGPSAIRTRTAANPARSGPFVPRRQESVRNAASGIAANSAATPTLLAEGTGCFLGRPFGFGAGQVGVTSAG